MTGEPASVATKHPAAGGPHGWDPYAVWQILVRMHPARDADPSGSVGRIDPAAAPAFLEAIADYPDYLQDTLIVIAHAEGIEVATGSLDRAVGRYLARRRDD